MYSNGQISPRTLTNQVAINSSKVDALWKLYETGKLGAPSKGGGIANVDFNESQTISDIYDVFDVAADAAADADAIDMSAVGSFKETDVLVVDAGLHFSGTRYTSMVSSTSVDTDATISVILRLDKPTETFYMQSMLYYAKWLVAPLIEVETLACYIIAVDEDGLYIMKFDSYNEPTIYINITSLTAKLYRQKALFLNGTDDASKRVEFGLYVPPEPIITPPYWYQPTVIDVTPDEYEGVPCVKVSEMYVNGVFCHYSGSGGYHFVYGWKPDEDENVYVGYDNFHVLLKYYNGYITYGTTEDYTWEGTGCEDIVYASYFNYSTGLTTSYCKWFPIECVNINNEINKSYVYNTLISMR